MLEPLVFSVPGEPVGKGRPRFRIVTPRGDDGRPDYSAQFVTVYTDKETENYEKAIGWRARGALRGRPPMETPVHVAVVIRSTPPQSWPQWKQQAALQGMIAPTTKPDADNVIKAVLDGLNTVAWTDDVLAVQGAWRKEYHRHEELVVKVTPLEKSTSRITRRDQLVALGRDLLALLRPLPKPERTEANQGEKPF